MSSLEQISLRLLNHKIYFTARNFFKLDETFCHMVGMPSSRFVTMCVVSDDSCNSDLCRDSVPVLEDCVNVSKILLYGTQIIVARNIYK